MKNEDLVLFIKNWAKKIDENKYSGQYMPISNINTKPNVTLYTFVQFVGKYLCTHQLELAYDKIETQKQLKKAILYGSTTQSKRTIDYQAKICSRIAKKWLNCLDYN